jgi:hypothetical protein
MTMPNEWPWPNSEMNLFLIPSEGKPRWLKYVGVSSLEWLEGQRLLVDCRFCGGRNETDALKCVHCGAALDSENIGAELHLVATLPGGRPALELRQGSVLEVLHKLCGDRAVYNSEEAVIRLTVRKMIRRHFENLVIFDSADAEAACAYMSVVCEMELLETWNKK